MDWKTTITVALLLIASTAGALAQPNMLSCASPKPILSTFLQPPYPTESQRDDEVGAVAMMVNVRPDGMPTGFVLNRSSGAKRLDDAASSFAMSKYRWEKSPDGCPASQQPITIIFQLGNPPKADGAVLVPIANYPSDALQLEEEGDTYLALSLGEGGAVKDLRIAYSSGYSELDNRSIAIVKASPSLTAGKPSGMYSLLLRWKHPADPNSNRITIHSQAMHLADAIEWVRQQEAAKAAACNGRRCGN